MELDAVRFCIGPWKGRYSSVWRVWSNPGSDDVYLGVRSLLRFMKISLHQSGKFRIGFTKNKNKKLVACGKSDEIDRAFLKWNRSPVAENEILQVLDIHFPLQALSLRREPEAKNGRKLFVMMPVERCLEENDSITVKVLFHRIHPESERFQEALRQRNLTLVFGAELSSGEHVSLSFQYSKQLPLNISDRETKGFAAMFHDYFRKSGKQVGYMAESLTIQLFTQGQPPAIHNIGGVSVCWESEKHFSINIGTPLL